MPTGCTICTRRDAKIHKQSTNVKVSCPRCGPYILTRRGSIVFLSNNPDQVASARASHAIRSRTSDKAPFKIKDNNVEEILSHPFPGLPKQLENLIGYLKEQAGDQHLKPIKIKDRNALLGVVGAADEAAFEGLLKYASGKGRVSLSQDGSSVKLTPEAGADSGSPKIVSRTD